MTAFLAAYAIIVIASCVCWVSFALWKAGHSAGSNTGDINVSKDQDKTKRGAGLVTGKAAELTGRVTEDAKADDQSEAIVKSTDL